MSSVTVLEAVMSAIGKILI